MSPHRLGAWLAAGLLLALAARGETPRLVDRIVAVVDDDPILETDVERVIAFGLLGRAEAGDREDREVRRRQALDALIEERLRLHEVERYGFDPVPPQEVDRQVEEIRSRFSDPEAFRSRLEETGLTLEGLRLLVAHQIQVWTYVEERLGARVFVSLEDIKEYYDAELRPRLEAQGETPPPLEKVREQIRQVLREERLNRELEEWTADLRARADVVDHLVRRVRSLPPVVTERPGADGSEPP
jgi:hypothetical protein